MKSEALKMLGTCALCQKNSDLQDSHLIPKWAYRRVLELDSTGAKAPVHIADGKAVMSNKQTKKHLLCADCEQRFSRIEDHVAGLTEPSDRQIKLFEKVTRLDTPQKVLASLNDGADAKQLAYFAASVMWRGCVMTGDCKLGPYESSFRQYLLGTAAFPAEAAIHVALLDESSVVDLRGCVSEPSSTKVNFGWLHGFLLAGLAFRCWVGKSIPNAWQQVSLAGPNPKKYISIIGPEGCSDFLAAADMAASAKPRGKLVAECRAL
jgi:hypothetical protein